MPGRPPNQAGSEPCKTSGNRHNAAITTSTFGGAEKRHTMRHPPTARGAVHPTLPAAQALPDTTECTLIGNPTTVTAPRSGPCHQPPCRASPGPRPSPRCCERLAWVVMLWVEGTGWCGASGSRRS